MKHIVFVGDKPSSKNKHQSVAFVGTPSYKVLLDWVYRMDVDITWTMMMNKDMIRTLDMASDETERYRRHTYIALGNEAAEELDKFKLEYFKLPHPSPRNRVLNDKKLVESKLKECRSYLDSKGWL